MLVIAHTGVQTLIWTLDGHRMIVWSYDRPDPCLQTGSKSGIQTLSRPYVCVELGPHGSMGIGGLVVAQPRVTRVATTLGASRASLAGRRTDPQNNFDNDL